MIEETIHKQVKILIKLGFPKLLNLSDEEYLNSFKFDDLKTSLSDIDRFGFPVLVDPRICIEELLLKAKVENYLKLEELKNVSSGSIRPYIFFTHDSKKYSTHTAETAITEFAEDQEGCTLEELIFYYLFYPDQFEGIAIDAILTNFRGEYHPCILKVTTKAEIGAHWHNDLTVGINILSKGKLLIEL